MSQITVHVCMDIHRRRVCSVAVLALASDEGPGHVKRSVEAAACGWLNGKGNPACWCSRIFTASRRGSGSTVAQCRL